jgi:hypothetical protein
LGVVVQPTPPEWSGRAATVPPRSDLELATEFERALAEGDGVAGAHCIHERWMRGDFAEHIETALELLWKRAGASIPDWLPMRYVSWLPAAYEIAAQFTANGSGRSNIYLILLDYADRRGDDHGVYVGMSRYPPAVRFDQHKAGIRAAGSVASGHRSADGTDAYLQHIKRTKQRVSGARWLARSRTPAFTLRGH